MATPRFRLEYPSDNSICPEEVPSYFAYMWGELVIYGVPIKSSFEEDQMSADLAWERSKRFLSYCYSVACPMGEMGFTQVSRVQLKLGHDDFMIAAELGWPEIIQL